MYDFNGGPLRPLQISRRSRLQRFVNGASMMLRELPPPVRMLIVIVLAVLIGLLAGCATPSTPPSYTPRNPSLPPPQQSQPTEPYLSRVLRNTEAWEKRLRGTLGTR